MEKHTTSQEAAAAGAELAVKIANSEETKNNPEMVLALAELLKSLF
ncbi:hypothetical protein [Pediococcus acidilactici]|nr:hypothetical protein [Pediococcus acidilactici]MBM6602855.1 hypothetical protein [Pediococcus acidilactici]